MYVIAGIAGMLIGSMVTCVTMCLLQISKEVDENAQRH